MYQVTAQELRDCRRWADMSVAAFAQALGVTTEELEEMEAGTRPIPLRFSVDAYDIAGDEAQRIDRD